jgi:ABC-type dipeptide/oligopeptide/nickel transport system permease component
MGFTLVVLRRLGSSVIAVIGASLLAFVILRVIPANPARVIVGPLAPQEAVDAQVHHMGLDQPLYTQYWRYISQFFTGDWGFSYSAGQPVAEQFSARFAATIELALYAFVLALVGAVVLALASTYRRRPVVDGSVRAAAFFGMGTPPFWLGLILLLVFFADLGIAPGPEGRLGADVAPPTDITGLYTVDALVTGQIGLMFEAFWHLMLPCITLALAPCAYLTRLLRANLLEVSREPFIAVARSKGVRRWSAYSRHALPNAFLPTLTASGIIFAQLLGGSVLIEKLFAWPGVGDLVAESILVQDYAVVQGFVLLSAVVYVLLSLVVDVLAGVIDPRVRRGSSVA